MRWGKVTRVQNRKKKDLWKGFEITKKDRNKAVAVDHVIDIDKRTDKNFEPKFTD